MNKLPLPLRLGILILAALGMFFFFFMKPAIIQDPAYHLFADQRIILGIPHFMDVVSNIFFLIVGYLGLIEVIHQKFLKTQRSWYWFFISIILIAPGSAYYHWDPNDSTLVWDRLPMSMGFMALYVALLSEHVTLRIEKALPFSLFLGLLSVITWAVTLDLRFYFWVQFSSFVTIPFILLLFQSRYTHKVWFVFTLIFYGLAKWTEIKDREIFTFTNEVISGHTLKHILAAVGLAGLWWMIKKRSEKTT